MEPAEASVSVKVPQLLSEADGLAKSDGAPVPRDQILRKLALAEWMLQLEGRRTLNKEGAEHLQELKTAVEAKRVELGATHKDVWQMDIPEPKSNGEEGGSPREDIFPHYLDLPGFLVREKILGFLTNPLDKLNLFRAIPSEGFLMKYGDLVHLQFQVIYPLLQKQRVLDWQTTYNLAKVDPCFRSLIYAHFKTQLEELQCMKQWNAGLSPRDLNPVLDLANQQDMDPIPAKVYLDFHGRMWQQPRIAENMEFLRRHGEKILDCHLEPGRAPQEHNTETLTEFVNRLSVVLGRMPNVVYLKLNFPNAFGDGEPPDQVLRKVIRDWPAVMDIPLPELKALKSLTLLGGNYKHPVFETVKRKLLGAYSQQLVSLAVRGVYLLPPLDLPFPNLRQLWVQPNSKEEDLEEDLYPYLHLVINSPLKVMHVDMRYMRDRGFHGDIFKRSDIPRLLSLLSTHFGSTLEELTLELGRSNKMLEEFADGELPPEPVVSPTWMRDCEFPQLKKLSMDPPPHPSGSGVLLLFPAMERFSMEVATFPEVDFWSREQIVSVSPQWDRMKVSNIWKLLPNLKEVGVSGDYYFDSQRRRIRCVPRYLTRRQCIAWKKQEMRKEPLTAAQVEKQWEVLKMVFPVLLKQGVLDWKVLYQLGRTHPFFRDGINAHLKTWLTGCPNKKEVVASALHCVPEHTRTDPEWCRRNPIPAKVRFLLFLDYEQNLSFLRECGSRIWGCRLVLPGNKTASESQEIVNLCLALMPNLISFEKERL